MNICTFQCSYAAKDVQSKFHLPSYARHSTCAFLTCQANYHILALLRKGSKTSKMDNTACQLWCSSHELEGVSHAAESTSQESPVAAVHVLHIGAKGAAANKPLCEPAWPISGSCMSLEVGTEGAAGTEMVCEQAEPSGGSCME